MQGPRAAGEVIEALARLDRDDDGRRHRHRPRRRLGRGPAALLRRGPAARGRQGAHPGRLRDRPRARPAAARPRRRRPRRHAHRRREARRARRRRRGPAASRPPASGCALAVASAVAREQRGLDALRSRPALADPRTLRRPIAPPSSTSLRDRARRTLGHRARPRRRRHRPPARPGPRALAAGHARSAATPCCRTPTATCVTSVGDAAAGAAVSVRVADGRVHADVVSTTSLPRADLQEERR